MDDQELAKYPGLRQRDNGIWYIRKRVPSDLVHVDSRGSIRISLDTADRKVAMSRYAMKLAEITAAFDRKRDEIKGAGKLSAALTLGRLDKLGRPEIEHLVAEWWQRRSNATAATASDEEDPLDAAGEREELDHWVQCAEARGEDPFATVADHLLVEAGFAARPHKVGRVKTQTLYPDLDRSQAAYGYLRTLVGRALQVEENIAKARAKGSTTVGFDPIFNPTGVKRAGDELSGGAGTVRDLIAEYRAEREGLHGKESTDRKYGLLFRVIEEVMGADRPAREIDRSKCVEVLSFLKRLPPNATKRFPHLTLVEAAAKADVDGLPGLAPNTVTSYMQNLSAILVWAERGNWGLKANTKGLLTAREPQVQRRGFSAKELETLFAALEAFRESDPTKYWVPALAAFTGARAGEICQLRAADVIDVDGVACLDLSLFDEKTGVRVVGNRLKNSSSERVVPLHRTLINAGFLDFAGGKTDRLFPDLVPGKKGSYSHNFSKWFGRFKVKVGFAQPSLVFHSFRHGFRDACRAVEIGDETVFALGGWASINQASRYGNRGMVPVLHRAIEKLEFGGFRLRRPS